MNRPKILYATKDNSDVRSERREKAQTISKKKRQVIAYTHKRTVDIHAHIIKIPKSRKRKEKKNKIMVIKG